MKAIFVCPFVRLIAICLSVWLLPPASSASAEGSAPAYARSIDAIVIICSSFAYKALTKADYPLSEASEMLLKKANLPKARIEGGDFEFDIKPQEELITIKVKDQWFPLTLRNSNSNEEILKADFKDGEFGLRKGNIFVREGTRARLRGTVYVYTSGGWQAK